jgi:hypothetical protein
MHIPRRPAPVGAVDFDTIANAFAAGAFANDPAARDVVQLAMEAIRVERQPGGLLDPRTPSTFSVRDLRTPLRAWLFFRRNKWALYALPAGILTLAFLAGRATK